MFNRPATELKLKGTALERRRYTPETEGTQMDDHNQVKEKETVIVERGGGGGVIAAIALLIAVLGVLAYFGMLPF